MRLSIAILLCVLQPVVANELPSTLPGDYAPPRVSVDLGMAPEHRWDHLAETRKDQLVTVIHELFSNPALKEVLPLLRGVVGNKFEAERILGRFYPEALGIARVLELPIADMVIVGIFYDLFAAEDADFGYHRACSSIVAESASGEIIHGRNLDYGFRRLLSNLTLVVDYMRDGQVQFTAVSFGPMPVFNTVVRHKAFSITHDQRDRGSIATNMLDLLVLGRMATFVTIREAAETQTDFEGALKFLRDVKLPAASYFIVGGTKRGEGAVITRDREDAVDVWRLNAAAGQWYVLETNYDHMVDPPFGDDRRAPLHRALDAVGPSHIDTASLWQVLSTQTVNFTAGERAPLNRATIYTTVMQAAKPESFKTIVRKRSTSFESPPQQPSEVLQLVV